MNDGDVTRLDHGAPEPGADPGALGAEAVTRLLALGRERDVRPVAGLVERLERPDGATWFASAVLDGLIVPWGGVDRLLSERVAPVEALRTLKDRGHAAIEHGEAFDDRVAGLAAYFIAVAAALVGHGERITRRDRARLDPMLLDLATVMPEPWANLLARAATVG